MTTIELDDVYEEPEVPAAVIPEKTTHLAFDEAMADFHIMFPEMDPEIIEVCFVNILNGVISLLRFLLKLKTNCCP